MNATDHGTESVSRRPVIRVGGRRALGLAVLAASGLAGTLLVAGGAPAAGAATPQWVATWGASSVVGSAIPGNTCPAGSGLTNATVRNVVFASAGGGMVRVRLTNAFGTQPLQIGHASVAVQASGATPAAGTLQALAFGGQPAVTIPAGGRVTSDPVKLSVTAPTTLLVSVFVPGPTGPITNHPFTAQGNFLGTGDQALATTATSFQDTPCWMLIDAVDVQPASQVIGAVVALGDSITDTANTTGNANHRWPDFLARRLNALSGSTLSVVNAGLGGNRVLAPRPEPYWGVPAIDRLDRDVFTESGVRAVILLEGINDIGFSATSDQIIAGYQQIISQTHAKGLPIIGATMTPFRNSSIFSDARAQTWTAVNTFVRTSGAFDSVIDLAAATASAGDPLTLNPAFDSGDHLHPNDAGTQAMANAIDLTRLLAIAQGTPPTPTPTPTVSATPSPTPTATPSPTPTGGGGVRCTLTYRLSSAWSTGFVAALTLANTGSAPITGWTLAFTFPGNQTIVNLWNGVVTQTGASVSVRDAGFNATIPAAGSVAFGFQASFSGTNVNPAAFTVNGTACTAG
jgi:lysophospholipase L1-like esterase